LTVARKSNFCPALHLEVAAAHLNYTSLLEICAP
jgi:hypothetical protein